MIKKFLIFGIFFTGMHLSAMENDDLNCAKALAMLDTAVRKQKKQPTHAPVLKYAKSEIRNGIIYSEHSAERKSMLSVKKFTAGSLKGQTHAVCSTVRGPSFVETVPLDDAEIHFKRLERMYDAQHKNK